MNTNAGISIVSPSANRMSHSNPKVARHRIVKIYLTVMTLFTCMALTAFVGSAAATELDQKALKIEQQLMAPCCWSQTVNNHESGIAKEMKTQIRQMLVAGKSSDEILTHFIALHGKRILAKPPVAGFDILAYVLPVFFLLLGSVITVWILKQWHSRNQSTSNPSPPLNIDKRYFDRLEQELKMGE